MAVHLLVLTGVTAVLGAYRKAGEVDEQLSEQAQQLLGRIELRLSFLVERTEEFARSSSITNSVIDRAGRSEYLPAAVRDFAAVESVASVTVVDYSGGVIERSAKAPNRRSLTLKTFFANGNTTVEALPESGRVLVTAPVSYYETVQGAVLVELNLEPAVRKVAQLNTGSKVGFSVSGHPVFAHERQLKEVRSVEKLAGDHLPNLQKIHAKALFGIPEATMMAPVWASVRESGLVGGIAMLLAFVFAWRIGSELAAPIRVLASKVRRGVHPCSPIGTDDELEHLACSFDEQREALVHSRERLEERVILRTASLAKKTIQLERSNEELDEFAYIASHDLKEPLRGIHNYSQFLIEDYGDVLDADGQSKLHTLSRLCQRMERIIDNLLEYSRLGRVELAYANTDLSLIVEDIRKDLEISLLEKDISLNVPRPLPQVWCDRIRIAEVLRNFITNAMKYNDKEDKYIEVGWKPLASVRGNETAAEDQVAFYIKDNGIGIREKHLNSIFKIFKRLHGRDKYGGGHGAGLTIVKKIVERHGGRVWVESEYGQGSTFWFFVNSESMNASEESYEAA